MTYLKKKHITRRGHESRTYRTPREYSYHSAIGPHGKLSNWQGGCTPSKVCGLPRFSGKMGIQTPMRDFTFVT